MKIFLPGLTLLFIGLKLSGHISWSWFWVLSPYPIAFGSIIVGLSFLYLMNAEFRAEVKKRTRERKLAKDVERMINIIKDKDMSA